MRRRSSERAGHPVRVVSGEAANVKITTTADLDVARERLARAPAAVTRVGVGYDLHRLVEGRPLILGGVTVPADRGALGHSDADVDLPRGDRCDSRRRTRRRYRPALSGHRRALEGCVEPRAVAAAPWLMVRERGWTVENVDVVVILERPEARSASAGHASRISPATLGVDAECVSIKAKTNEGMDAVGRGEAIATHAVALLKKS